MTPIKVLQIVTTMNRGGLETMLMNYYRQIDKGKIQFDFLVHTPNVSDYDKEIESLGGHVYHISRLIPWSQSYKKELKVFFFNHPEYKVVHVHQDCLSSVALSVAKECEIPIRIAHSHNSNQDHNLKYLVKLHYMKSIPAYATDLFACGKDAGDWMFRGHLYQILNNAVNTKDYKYDKDLSYKIKSSLNLQDKIVYGHVGRFNEQKNHAYLIDIFNEILKKQSNAHLLLVGDGDLRSSIEEKIKSLKLEDHITLTGVRSDVNELLQAMDVFVFPSLYEGLPFVLVEAQSSGLPCLISNTIPQDCVLTNLIHYKDLNDSAESWANEAIELSHNTNREFQQSIIEKGFDIQTEALKLQNFYLSKYEEVQ